MPLSDEERSKLISLWEAGTGVTKIAKMLGITRKTVDKWLLRYQTEGTVTPRLTNQGAKKKRLTELERRKIIGLREAGFSVPSIADQLGISLRTAYLWLRRHSSEGHVKRRVPVGVQGARPGIGEGCEMDSMHRSDWTTPEVPLLVPGSTPGASTDPAGSAAMRRNLKDFPGGHLGYSSDNEDLVENVICSPDAETYILKTPDVHDAHTENAVQEWSPDVNHSPTTETAVKITDPDHSSPNSLITVKIEPVDVYIDYSSPNTEKIDSTDLNNDVPTQDEGTTVKIEPMYDLNGQCSPKGTAKVKIKKEDDNSCLDAQNTKITVKIEPSDDNSDCQQTAIISVIKESTYIDNNDARSLDAVDTFKKEPSDYRDGKDTENTVNCDTIEIEPVIVHPTYSTYVTQPMRMPEMGQPKLCKTTLQEKNQPCRCGICSKSFSPENPEGPIGCSGDKNGCYICGRSFPRKCYLNRHLLSHFKDRQFTCDICGQGYGEKRFLVYHIKVTHSDQRPYVCNICRKSFKTQSVLLGHRMTHTDDGPHRCKKCSQTFAKETHLDSHMLTHSGNQTCYSCDACSKSFAKRSILVNHMLTHSGQRPHRCNVCNKTFLKRCNLTVHKLTHSGDRKLRCDICGLTFIYRQQLGSHMLTHSNYKPFNCDLCDTGFQFKYQLDAHKRDHFVERPHKCDICPKTFIKKAELTRHIPVHSGDRPYHCELCKKRFTKRTNLTTHMLIHSGDRPHKCGQCTFTFMYKYQLDNHMSMHSGLQSHRCDVCTASFKYKYQLNSHVLTHSADQVVAGSTQED